MNPGLQASLMDRADSQLYAHFDPVVMSAVFMLILVGFFIYRIISSLHHATVTITPVRTVTTLQPIAPEALPAGSQLVSFGDHQPEYTPLPAAVDDEGTVMTEWSMGAGRRIRIWLRYAVAKDDRGIQRPMIPMAVEKIDA